jgi:hypothetical protein
MAGSFSTGDEATTDEATTDEATTDGIAAAVPARPARVRRIHAARRTRLYLLDICFYRIDTVESARWLARVRHDLLKRLVWPARDRRDIGGPPVAGELVANLVDDDGGSTTAHALWNALVADGPDGHAAGPALGRFEAALTRGVSAAASGDVDGVLALEPAFDELARSLEEDE